MTSITINKQVLAELPPNWFLTELDAYNSIGVNWEHDTVLHYEGFYVVKNAEYVSNNLIACNTHLREQFESAYTKARDVNECETV
jgi:hypothetical protein